MAMQLYYPIFLTLAILLTLILIPRDRYKQFFIYGFILGGLGDFVIAGLLSYLGIAWFPNAGIFQLGRLNILSPLSWVPVTMLFLRFLPQRPLFLYGYIFTFATFGVCHGYVIQNVGLYDFQPWYYPGGAFLIILGLLSLITFVFIRSENSLEMNKL